MPGRVLQRHDAALLLAAIVSGGRSLRQPIELPGTSQTDFRHCRSSLSSSIDDVKVDRLQRFKWLNVYRRSGTLRAGLLLRVFPSGLAS